MFNKYSQDTKDMMIVSIMAHDFFKYGLPEKAGKYTTSEHPVTCRDFIFGNKELQSMLEPEQVKFIGDCIASHSGQWNTDYRSKKEILPKPVTGPQNLVHLADFLVSRRYINIDFEGDYYEPAKPELAAPIVDAELEKLKSKIVDKCKAKIEAGISNKDIYAMIAAENNGNRNPNSITDPTVAKNVLHKLEEMNV